MMGFRMVGAGLILMFSSISFASEVADWQHALETAVIEQQTSGNIVGLGAFVVQGDDVLAMAVAGERKVRSDVAVTVDDSWHIGSVTKSFTATMMARLVEQGRLDWQMTLTDVFADEEDLHPGWQGVTLYQLLTHTSGAARNFSVFVHAQSPAPGLERMAARERAVLSQLRQAPDYEPGSQFAYSNVGYTMAGVMAEKVTGQPWEALMKQALLQPLRLDRAGFGAPADNGTPLSQPRGHRSVFGIRLASAMDADNTPIIGPAGTLHMSMTDLARYASEHLAGRRGQGALLSDASYHQLHQPHLGNYALGWVVNVENAYGLGDMIWHNGSNTRWYTLLVLFPEPNLAIGVVSNDGRIAHVQAHAWQLVDALTSQLEP